jgi:arginyl-tRNA synthetase
MREREAKYKFDKMIYVVASQQDLHLQQLFMIVQKMGLEDLAARCVHINFGMGMCNLLFNSLVLTIRSSGNVNS